MSYLYRLVHYRSRALPALAFVALSLAASAAVAAPSARPIALAEKVAQPLAGVTRIGVEVPDIDAALADDQQKSAAAGGKIAGRRFAVAQPVALDFVENATWTELPDGRRVGRMRLHSPGALSLNLAFDHFEPGAGQLW